MTRRALPLAVGLALAAPAAAAPPTVRVGTIASAKDCALYRVGAGRERSAAAIGRGGAAYAAEASWAEYLVRDCVDHFASLRTSLQAALAASGRLAVVPGAGAAAYVVGGRISDTGGATATMSSTAPGAVADHSSATTQVSMEVTVRDGGGRIVHGALVTKRLETNGGIATPGLATAVARSPEASWAELQQQVALAVARNVAFAIAPLRVTAVTASGIRLDGGAPLLQLGTLVQVTAPDGTIARYGVTGAGQGSAEAVYQGGGPAAAVTPGSPAMVLEADDPAANARRLERVDLP